MVLRQSILGLGQMVMDHHHISRFITLWKYAITTNYRSDLVRANGQPTATWTKQRNLFGQTEAQQQQCWEREKRAYYGLVDTNNIVDIMHMCRTFKSGTADHDHDSHVASDCHVCCFDLTLILAT